MHRPVVSPGLAARLLVLAFVAASAACALDSPGYLAGPPTDAPAASLETASLETGECATQWSNALRVLDLDHRVAPAHRNDHISCHQVLAPGEHVLTVQRERQYGFLESTRSYWPRKPPLVDLAFRAAAHGRYALRPPDADGPGGATDATRAEVIDTGSGQVVSRVARVYDAWERFPPTGDSQALVTYEDCDVCEAAYQAVGVDGGDWRHWYVNPVNKYWLRTGSYAVSHETLRPGEHVLLLRRRDACAELFSLPCPAVQAVTVRLPTSHHYAMRLLPSAPAPGYPRGYERVNFFDTDSQQSVSQATALYSSVEAFVARYPGYRDFVL